MRQELNLKSLRTPASWAQNCFKALRNILKHHIETKHARSLRWCWNMVSSRGPKVRHQNLFTRFCAPLNRLHFSSPPASCAPLFCRPWCLNSHSALHIASFSKRKKIKIFLFLGQSLQIRFCNFTKKEGRTHLQSIYKKGRYGLGLARACVNEQHWMDLVGWGTKEDINSVLAPFSGGFQLTNHTMPYHTRLYYTIPADHTIPEWTIRYYTS